MKSALPRVVLSLILLMLCIPGFAITFLLIEEYWISDDELAAFVTAVLFYVVLVAAWLLIWWSRLIWTPRRRLTTILTVPGAPLVGLVIGLVIVAFDEYADEEAVAWGVFASYFLWLAVTAWVWPARPAEKMALLLKEGFGAIGCPKCQYDMRGSTEARCPECGHESTIGELLASALLRHDTGALTIERLNVSYRRLIKWGGIATAACLLIGLIALIVFDVWTRNQWDDAVVAWETAGGELSATASLPDAVPDAMNAAVLYKSANESAMDEWSLEPLWRSMGPIESPRPKPLYHEVVDETEEPAEVLNRPWAASDEALRRAVNIYREPLALVREGMGRPHCVWRDKSVISDIDFLNYWESAAQAVTLAKVMLCQAVLTSRGGKHDAAQAELVDVLTFADHVQLDPTLMNWMQSVVIRNLALRTIHALHRHRPITSEELRQAIEQIDPHAGFVRAVQFEGASIVELTESGKLYELLDLYNGWPRSAFLRRDAAVMVQVYASALPRYKMPYHKRPGTAALPFGPDADLLTDLSWYWVGGTQMDIQDQAGARLATHVALARFAMKLRKIRKETGQFPATDSIEQPADLHTGGSTRYQRLGDGFLLAEAANAIPQDEPLWWLWDTNDLPKEFHPAVYDYSYPGDPYAMPDGKTMVPDDRPADDSSDGQNESTDDLMDDVLPVPQD